MSDNYVMRRMSRDELDMVVEWAADEGWNPGLHDADAFFAADPGGFYIGLLDGEPVASLSVVRYGPEYAFMGFYIVRPAARGKGYGLRLWLYALEQTQATNLGLDGVVDQQDNYRRSGFVLAHRNVRYETTASGAKSAAGMIRTVASADSSRVMAYDQRVFAAARVEFLQRWLSLPGSHAVVAGDSGVVSGYGLVRRARDGYRIGPLFAETADVASQLLDALMASVNAGSRVALDVPASNDAAVRIAEQHGMTPAFETSRMYTQDRPRLDVTRVFGITSLELG